MTYFCQINQFFKKKIKGLNNEFGELMVPAPLSLQASSAPSFLTVRSPFNCCDITVTRVAVYSYFLGPFILTVRW